MRHRVADSGVDSFKKRGAGKCKETAGVFVSTPLLIACEGAEVSRGGQVVKISQYACIVVIVR
jgi:hypothetical protein